jgi:transcriptional regulator with XRE-family HTH domain
MSREPLDRTRLGRAVKAARQRAKLTQAELAERAAVSDETVGRLERGAFEPSLGTMLAVSRALGSSVDALAEGREGPRTAAREPGSRYEAGHAVDLSKLPPELRRLITDLVRALAGKAKRTRRGSSTST